MSSSNSSSRAAGGADSKDDKVFFGPFDVTTQVFLRTRHSFALVNLKPLLPGHVLVCPRAPHRRLTDLTPPELTDLMLAVQRVQRALAAHYFPAAAGTGATGAAGATGGTPESGSFNIALQDGPGAGQTVAHVHVHVIPRISGATAKPAGVEGDKLYEEMAGEEGNVGGALWDRERARARARSAAAGAGAGAGAGAAAQSSISNSNSNSNSRPVPGGGFPRIEDEDRVARSMEEMEAEAALFKEVLARIEK
ncbi:uncharacterized protein E0L32_008555 [Thyridium curvatum]|uniref:Bis(5'-adenosyl)-triphosphatase n=1 Tax=Thyridium curvatum TaxID=1093900 RepID=A0A507AJK1_9PEZI|nr:uncharacterized protein E0L32_008555 [Thyridium curvatum]TPX10505.1 hypothetical protein E0L32_008555 [Thyridium curvatum]